RYQVEPSLKEASLGLTAPLPLAETEGEEACGEKAQRGRLRDGIGLNEGRAAYLVTGIDRAGREGFREDRIRATGCTRLFTGQGILRIGYALRRQHLVGITDANTVVVAASSGDHVEEGRALGINEVLQGAVRRNGRQQRTHRSAAAAVRRESAH